MFAAARRRCRQVLHVRDPLGLIRDHRGVDASIASASGEEPNVVWKPRGQRDDLVDRVRWFCIVPFA